MSITRKINKKMLGGKLFGPDNIDILTINTYFYNFFMFYLKKYNLQYEKNIGGTPKYIYIGFIEPETTNIIFGTTDLEREFGSAGDNKLTIQDNDTNRSLVNQCKLYIMSIMANYDIEKNGKDTNIYKEFEPLLNPLKMPEIIDLLKIEAVVCKPPPPPVFKVNDEIMLELQIYKEFGVKCTTAKECYNDIADKFYEYNKDEIRSRSRDLIRNLYVTIFDYITGSDDLISAFGNKESAYTTCMNKAFNALTELNKELHDFIGARTKIDFNIKKLIIGINSIRQPINESLNIKSTSYIKEI